MPNILFKVGNLSFLLILIISSSYLVNSFTTKSIVIAYITFLLSSIVFTVVAYNLPHKIWIYGEYILVTISFLGLVFVLAQISNIHHENKRNQQYLIVSQSLERVVRRTEYILHEKGIWWNDVLKDYGSSREHRIGHLVMQQRKFISDPGQRMQVDQTLFDNLCGSIYEDFKALCNSVKKHDEAVIELRQLNKEQSDFTKILSSNNGIYYLQLVIALSLGFQVGKITLSIIREKHNKAN